MQQGDQVTQQLLWPVAHAAEISDEPYGKHLVAGSSRDGDTTQT